MMCTVQYIDNPPVRVVAPSNWMLSIFDFGYNASSELARFTVDNEERFLSFSIKKYNVLLFNQVFFP